MNKSIDRWTGLPTTGGDMNTYCERCGEKLNESRSVMLELNSHTGRYSNANDIPAEQSQGWFHFGVACAKAVLKNNGECEWIGIKKRRGRRA